MKEGAPVTGGDVIETVYENEIMDNHIIASSSLPTSTAPSLISTHVRD
jgi:vacuolar-type H+-ATPase catalytic subunit A/Vma1